jgi:autotransporter-associated beta strand protein
VLGDIAESAASSITMGGLRTLYLQGAGGYSGTTTISSGTLQVGGIAAGGTTGGALGGGAVTNNATLAFNRSNAYTVSNAISGTGAVQNLGSGVVSLGGANSYSGTTTVSAGTLRVNGTHAGAGSYAVNNGGTLGGTGTITPASGAGIVVNSGGSIAPGASIGTLTIDNVNASVPALTLGAGATLRYELNNSFQSDKISILNAAAGAVAFNNNAINFTDLSGSLGTGDYTLIMASAAGAYSNLTVDGSNVITAGLSIGTGLEAYATKSLKLSGNNIVLNIAAAAFLVGDYNGNGTVDAADYVVWRKAQAAGALTLTNRDLNNTGVVGPADYNSWRANFGKPGAGAGSSIGAGSSVPEPTTTVLAMLAFGALSIARQRCRERSINRSAA